MASPKGSAGSSVFQNSAEPCFKLNLGGFMAGHLI